MDTVRAFASRGARVFVAVRDVDKTRQILDGIAASYPNNGGLEIIHMELESLSSVNTAADEFIAHSSQLHILVNNAGMLQLLASTSLTPHRCDEHSLSTHQRWARVPVWCQPFRTLPPNQETRALIAQVFNSTIQLARGYIK